MARCTVCDFEINNANPRLTSSYNGKQFEFCCPVCKGAFDAAPDRFSARAGARPEPAFAPRT